MSRLQHRSSAAEASAAELYEFRIAQWGDAVDSAHREQRERPGEFEALTDRLSSWTVPARIVAARLLRAHGERAVKPLCDALRDPDYEVRAAAAASLGELGDERAIRPMIRALHRCFEGRSPTRSLWVGVGTVLGMFAALILALAATIVVLGGTALWAWGVGVAELLDDRRKHTELVRAIIKALVRITERTGSSELRRALPDLKVVALDVIRHGRQTRASSRAAVARIEALTSRLRDLPLPADGDTPQVATLPSPSQAPETPSHLTESIKA